MPTERLLASYIVRILLRNGLRSIRLHQVGSGDTNVFRSYRELIAYLADREEAAALQGSRGPPADEPP